MNTHAQRRVQRAGLPRLDVAHARTTSMLGVAPLFHITGPHRRTRRRAAGPDAARARPTASTRASCSTLIERAPADVHRRGDHRVHRPHATTRACEPSRPRLAHKIYSRRRAHRPERGRGASRSASGRPSTTSTGSPRPRRRRTRVPLWADAPGRPDLGRAVGRRADLQHRRADRRRGRARTCRPARSASSSRPGPQVVAGYWNKPEETAHVAARRPPAHRRRRLHGRARAGSTSSTARRT